MRKILVRTAFLAMIFFISCDFGGETMHGNGKLKSETRSAANTDKLDVMGAMNVFVEQGSPSIRVEGDENILQYIETRTDNDWLEIKTRDHINVRSKNPIRVYVSTPDISALKVTGSGNLTFNNKFSSHNNLSFGVTGSGNIYGNINTPAVNANITGSGNMYLKGETRNVDIQVTGSGNYDSPGLKAENAKVKIMGSGDVNLFADASLNASIAGSGDVKYSGNARVDKSIAGSGSVIKVP